MAVARGALVGIGLLGVCLPAYEYTVSGSSTYLPLPQKVKTCNGSYLGQNLAVMVEKVTDRGT